MEMLEDRKSLLEYPPFKEVPSNALQNFSWTSTDGEFVFVRKK